MFWCSTFFLAITPVSSSAYCDEVRKKQLPKSGMLASAGISGAGNSIVSDLFGSEDIFSGELPPVAGSVFRSGADFWVFRVINNSDDRYLVNVDLVQRNENDAVVKRTSYTYSIKPHQSEQEKATAGFGARKAELYLRSYRNLSAEQRAKEKK